MRRFPASTAALAAAGDAVALRVSTSLNFGGENMTHSLGALHITAH